MVENWKAVGPILEVMKQQEIREEDNITGLRHLTRAINYATRKEPPCQDSGLEEMQFHMAKLRK